MCAHVYAFSDLNTRNGNHRQQSGASILSAVKQNILVHRMHISRFASLVAKPLLSSLSPRVAPVLWAPCRSITTGQAHVRFGNVGGRQKEDISRELDVFLGTWTTNAKKAEKYADYMTDRDRQELEKMKAGEKTYHSFSRNNGDWISVTGVVGAGNSKNYVFKMGVPFVHKHKDEKPVNVLVVQDIKGMTWVFRSTDKKHQVTSSHMMVRKGKLFINKVHPDGTVSFNVFFKE